MSTNQHSQVATMTPVAEEAIELAEVAPRADGDSEKGATVERFVDAILSRGVEGFGPLKSAEAFAEEHLAQHGDVEKAIERVIATHTRLVAASGFATGLGGPITMVVGIPTDVSVFYALSARCVAAVAHLRGYDTASDEVRSVVLLSLLGAGGSGLAADFGATLGTKAAMAALRSCRARHSSRSTRRSASGCSRSSAPRASSTSAGGCRSSVAVWEPGSMSRPCGRPAGTPRATSRPTSRTSTTAS